MNVHEYITCEKHAEKPYQILLGSPKETPDERENRKSVLAYSANSGFLKEFHKALKPHKVKKYFLE